MLRWSPPTALLNRCLCLVVSLQMVTNQGDVEGLFRGACEPLASEARLPLTVFS